MILIKINNEKLSARIDKKRKTKTFQNCCYTICRTHLTSTNTHLSLASLSSFSKVFTEGGRERERERGGGEGERVGGERVRERGGERERERKREKHHKLIDTLRLSTQPSQVLYDIRACMDTSAKTHIFFV
jgi:hypothetical protein